jgi:PAS domain-containing protein
MWVWDDEALTFLSVNQAAIDHYGYTREEFLQMSLRDLWATEEETRYEENLRGRAGAANPHPEPQAPHEKRRDHRGRSHRPALPERRAQRLADSGERRERAHARRAGVAAERGAVPPARQQHSPGFSGSPT